MDHTLEENIANFFELNSNLMIFTIFLALFLYFLPRGILKTPGKFLFDQVLPCLFFCIFSLFFGLIFLLNVKYLEDYLIDTFDNKLFSIGIIGGYTGIISILLAGLFRSILEKLYNASISSSMTKDIIGFLFGRIILLCLAFYKVI